MKFKCVVSVCKEINDDGDCYGVLLSKFIRNVLDENPLFINEREFDYLAPLDYSGDLSVLSFLEDAEYIDLLPKNITMILTTSQVYPSLSGLPYGICVISEPRNAFFLVHNYLAGQDGYRRRKFPNQIHSTAKISPLAYIEDTNVIIKAGVQIEPFAVVYSNSTIECNAIIRASASIGGVGYEFKRTGDGIIGVTHSGGTIVCENTEIHYKATVDKALYPWDDTVIGSNSKILAQTYVAHGCKVGSRAVIGSHASLGGRIVFGDDVKIGDGSVIRQLVTIQNKAHANEGAVITKSVGEREIVSGNFAILHSDFVKLYEDYTFPNDEDVFKELL